MTQFLNRRRFTAGVALAPLAAGGLLAGCSGMPDTVRIGVAQPLSGPLAALGQDLLNGVMLAVKELNANNFSVDGKRVALEVVTVDDKADAEVGKQVAQQLVDGGICAVIGHLNSGVSIAAAPIYAGKGIAQIAISTNPKYTDLGFPTTLRMVANDKLQGAALASFGASNWGASATRRWTTARRMARICRKAQPSAWKQQRRAWCCASRLTTRPWLLTNWPRN